MGELERIYADAMKALAGGVRMGDVDLYVREETKGKTPNFDALKAVVTAPKPGSWLGAFGQGMAANRVPNRAEGEAMAAGGVQGATLGFADEGLGLLGALGGFGNPIDNYRGARDRARGMFKDAQAAAPGSYDVGVAGGGFLVPGAKAASTALGAGRGLLSTGIRTGAMFGGAAGAGFSEADNPVGLGTDVAQGITLGAAVGGLSAAAIASVQYLANKGVALFDRNGAVQREAMKKLRKLLEQAGRTPDEVMADLQAIERAAPGGTIMAQGIPELGGPALQVAADRNPAVRAGVAAHGEQIAGQPDRLARRLEQSMGVSAAGAREAQEASKSAMAPFRKRLYGPLEGEYVTSPGLERTLVDPDIETIVAGAKPTIPAGQLNPATHPMTPAAEIAKVAEANPSGFTYDPRTGSLIPMKDGSGAPYLHPKTGQPFEGGMTAVAVVNGPRGGVAPDEVAGVVQRFYDEHGVALRNDPTLAIGGWRDADGRTYIDLVRLTGEPQATGLGKQLGQNSVANLDLGTFPSTGGNAATTIDAPPRSFEWVQRVLRDVRDRASSAFQNSAGGMGAKMKELTGRLEASLNDDLPGFAAAQQTYPQGVTVRDAFEVGARWDAMPNAEVVAEAAKLVARGGQEAMDAARMGFVLKKATELRMLPTWKDVARTFTHMGPDRVKTMQLLFPTEESFNNFMASVRAEGLKAATYRGATAGPNTARRLADQEGTSVAESAARGGWFGGIPGAVTETGRTLMGRLAGSFGRDVQGELGNMLLANPEVAASLLGRVPSTSLIEPGLAGLLGGGAPNLINQLGR